MTIKELDVMDLGSAWNRVVIDKEQGRVSSPSIAEVTEMLAQKPALLETLQKRIR